MQKVSKSTSECAAYNAANAEAINAGLLEGVEPDAAALNSPKQEGGAK